jgi:hypothetical protein
VADPEISIGYYSFIYRRNDSAYTSTEKLIVTPEGMTFVGHPDTDFIEIQSGGDNIIVMRNIEAFGSSSYSMSMANNPRPISDSELIE